MTDMKVVTKEQPARLLDDAVKCKTSMRGQSLLQWDWRGKTDQCPHCGGAVNPAAMLDSHRWPRHSVQMPTEIVDIILKWRDRENLGTKKQPKKGKTLCEVFAAENEVEL